MSLPKLLEDYMMFLREHENEYSTRDSYEYWMNGMSTAFGTALEQLEEMLNDPKYALSVLNKD